MIEINGSLEEGGGQIIRNALALSTITGKPFKAVNIRKGRPNPGLKTQHLACLKILKELTGSKYKGAELGSEELEFYPGHVKTKNIELDMGTAGSITLLTQSLILPIITSGKRVQLKIIGGTDVKWSMPIDYFTEVHNPYLSRYAKVISKTEKRGYHPKGNGLVNIILKGKYKNVHEAPKLQASKKGKLIQIKGVSHASNELSKAQVAERMARAAKVSLKKYNTPINIRTEYQNTTSIGAGITLWAILSEDPSEIKKEEPIILGSDALGEKGRKAEIIGEEAAKKLTYEIDSNASVDQRLADNLIPLIGFYGGEIKTSKITKHTLSAIYITELFLDVKITVDKNTITCDRGYSAKLCELDKLVQEEKDEPSGE